MPQAMWYKDVASLGDEDGDKDNEHDVVSLTKAQLVHFFSELM